MRQSGNVNIFKCDLLGFADDKSGNGLRVEDGRKTREDIDNVDIQFEPSGQKKQIRKDKKDVKELRFRSRGNIIR